MSEEAIKKLKPCPFCGCVELTVWTRREWSADPMSFYVECSCGGKAWEARTQEEAIAAWNRRART
jgi:Lar family restriction alleviation protein